MQERQDTGSDAAFTGASSNNQLVAAANPLLNAIPQIRHSVSHDDQVALRQRLIDEIRRFEVRCQQAGLPYEVIVGARYCLCTALDEAAALTPWGSSGVWSSNGLLVTFHNETWGGEKFFQLLARLSQNPREHILLLEMINYCLLLGFEDGLEGFQGDFRNRLTGVVEDLVEDLPRLGAHAEQHDRVGGAASFPVGGLARR